MGLFDFMKKGIRQEAPEDPMLRALLNPEEITRDTAMKIPAVSAGIDLISQTFALIPFKLYERYEEDGVKKVREYDDPRVNLLNVDPKDTLDGYQMKKAVCEDYFLGKGGYIYIDKSWNDARSLRYVKEERIAFQYTDTNPIFKKYYINIDGKAYYPMSFVKFLRSTRDGMMGTPIIREVDDALRAAYSTLRYQIQLMAKGGNRKGFLQANKTLGKDEQAALKRAWETIYSNNTDNVPILNNGVTFKESSSSAVELQLNQSKNIFAKEINDILHISEDYQKFIKDAIQPLCTAFATALNRDFLLEKEKDTLFWEADFTEILKGSAKERYDAYKSAVEGGWITKNEIRERENLQKVEGLDVIDFKLSAVLFDINTGEYYVPNTDKNGGTYGRDAPDDIDT